MTVTLCDLATRLPLLVGLLLDREAKLNRGRFREETMTDLLTGALAAFAGPELLIEYPPEAATGGDLDLRFWHAASGRDLYLRLQAKRLGAAMDAGKLVKLAHRAYGELLHRPNKSAPYQYRTLAAAPAPWIPLYLFYNHQTVVDDRAYAGKSPTVSGINLAFAADVRAELDLKVAAAAATPRKVLHHKRLDHLRPHFFGLEAILCPGGDLGGARVPTPDRVSETLRQRWNDREGVRKEVDEEVLRRLMQPGRLHAGREGRGRPADGPAVRITQAVEFPTVTFISGRTEDARTPIISERAARD